MSDLSHLQEELNTAMAVADKNLLAIDTINETLGSFQGDTNEKQYYDSSIAPLLLTMNSLSSISANLSSSVGLLTSSPIVPRKKSKLKDTINLIYKINSECENIYDVLKQRVDLLIDRE